MVETGRSKSCRVSQQAGDTGRARKKPEVWKPSSSEFSFLGGDWSLFFYCLPTLPRANLLYSVHQFKYLSHPKPPHRNTRILFAQVSGHLITQPGSHSKLTIIATCAHSRGELGMDPAAVTMTLLAVQMGPFFQWQERHGFVERAWAAGAGVRPQPSLPCAKRILPSSGPGEWENGVNQHWAVGFGFGLHKFAALPPVLPA